MIHPHTTIICSCHINILSLLYVLFLPDSDFPYLHTLEEFLYGIALIHPLDIDQRGMHGFPGFLNWNSYPSISSLCVKSAKRRAEVLQIVTSTR